MIGQAFGHYRILEKIGAGGMGEVYRATDTHLSRDVAIKVLPEAFSRDPERLARFRREAQVLASLNHPNIATVYGLEESEGTRLLVMELVPGPTLAEQLARGPLPIDEALKLAGQIAEALEAAHEKGIVHRDLKPGNIKVTPQGKAKVLDFGLAKAHDGGTSDSDLANSPTLSAVGTREGAILGTAAYMSPEQARGKPVDRRTDVWAFGCVLYEMLTGCRAFPGPTASDVIVNILREEPDWRRLPAETPPSIRRLLLRCLQKDPAQRLRDTGDARLEIEDALRETAEPLAGVAPAGGAPSPLASRAFIASGILLTLAVVAGAWWLRGRLQPASDAQTVRMHRLTDFVGIEEFPAISPDGRSVAFVADVRGRRHIWVRLLAGGPPLQITHDSGDHLYPRWAPDSTSLVYFAPPQPGETQGVIWQVSALGGPPRRIASGISGADVSHDGKRLAAFQFHEEKVRLVVLGLDGSNPREIAQFSPGNYFLYPRWSPDDQRIAYQQGYVFAYDLFVVDAAGGTPRQVTREGTILGGFTWALDGSGFVLSSARASSVLYLPTLDLWAIGLNGKDLRQLTFGGFSIVDPDLSASGILVSTRVQMRFNIWKFPADGSPLENTRRSVQITRQTGIVQTPSVSPDGKELVYLSDSGGHGNLWVIRMETGETRQITFERDPQVAVGVPVWSPDGSQVAFVSTRGNPTWAVGLWLVHPDGSGLRNLAPLGGWASWSRDGAWIYFNKGTGSSLWRNLVKMRMPEGPPIPVRNDGGTRSAPAPDDETLYFVVELPNITGGNDYEIRVAKPDTAPSRVLARIPAHRFPNWLLVHPVLSPDGKWLAMPLSDGLTTNLWALSTSDGKLRQLTDFGTSRTFIARRVSWSPDGRSLYAAVGDGDADIVLLEALLF